MERGAGPAVLVTSRPLENTHTGVDLSVPAFQLIRGKMLSGHAEYNIVVVAQLAAFKSAKHKPEDIVQFMVSKTYSEIEEFYQKLVTRYPQTALPPLPRKVMFVSESEIRERRAAFNKIMRSISKEPGLATSPELLEFLGTRSTCVTDVKSKNLPDEEEDKDDEFVIGPFSCEDVTVGEEEVAAEEKESEEEEEEEDDGDPLGVLKSKKTKKSRQSQVQKDKPKLTLFDEEVDPGEGLFGSAKDSPFVRNKRILAAKGNDLKLFEDPDLGERVTVGDPLLLPSACVSQEPALNSRVEEDTDELLRVEEDFEKMWKLSSRSKPKPPPKPIVPKKPTEAVAKLSSSSGQKAQQTGMKVEAMGEVDILKYIQENESVSSEEPSLF
uniref:HCLS1-binding protein 3 n=1 Tax=Pogona vitticeps TaxID=103695 RepID=A0A6J0SY03_9SAUR